jgi:tetratricopeptide (TPR) repeat protein
VLLIGWDGADWNLIHPLLDAGQMPHLARLVETGVIANLATLHPCLSPMLWTSVATGKTADKHGICGFLEPQPDGAGVRPVASTSRRTKALWNILSQQGLRSAVIGWQVSHPAEPIRGVCVSDRFADVPDVPHWGTDGEVPPPGRSDALRPEPPPTPLTVATERAWPVLNDSVHPRTLLPALASLRVHPAEIRPPDLTPLIPQIREIHPQTDSRPAELARLLARCGSVQAAATAVLETEAWDLLAVYFETLDLAGHRFMPYHPPRLPQVAASDFDCYHDVINALYRFHDQMLGRLLELAGPGTTVMLVSDHGFHSDHRRPRALPSGPVPEAQAAAWHRPYGIFVLNGPPVLADRRTCGATLLDIAPTVLTLLGLPIGRDMDGRPLIEALNRPVTPAYVASWDTEPGDDGQHPRAHRQDPFESAALVRHFIDLGYLPAATADANRAVAIVTAEAQFNLAAVHLHHGRPEAARPLLEALHATWPDHPRFALCLAKCYADLARPRECRQLIEGLERRGVREAQGDLLIAAALFQEGEADAALTRLTEAQRRHADDPLVGQLVGELYLAQHRWRAAGAAFAQALAVAPDHAAAHQGLAAAGYELGEWDQAIDHALQAVGLRFFAPQAHYFLGMALARKGDTDRAIAALETAVAQAPRFGEAHYHLMRLYETLGRVGEALHHRELAFVPRPRPCP